MNWEETIEFIRKKPEYKKLIEQAYFEEDLSLNVERFKSSEEFIETIKLVDEYKPDAKKILDIGSGNGISAVSFGLKGFDVTSIEPDSSDTVGTGAIRKLIKHYNLGNLSVVEAFAEEMPLQDNYFDIVYIRQAMHHANNLEKFIEEVFRVLKKDGILLTVRDHVIYNKKDKEWFLNTHDLHKFYGGENAYTANGYENVMRKSGFQILKVLRYYDSVINYFPMTAQQMKELPQEIKRQRLISLKNKLGFLSNYKFIQWLYDFYLNRTKPNILDEKNVAGRMYSYIAIKK